MGTPKYEPLKQQSSENLSESDGSLWRQNNSLATAWKLIYSLTILLGISIAFLAFLSLRLHNTQNLLDTQSFVGLQKNIPTAIVHDDRTIDDPMWESSEFDHYIGWLALDRKYVEQKGVPSSMRWPWDSSKGVYYLHSFHSLHCVLVIRDALMEFRDTKHQTWPFKHVTHCLHVLREDVICAADDTPRYTGHLHALTNSTEFSSGVGQVRMCRDWGKLRQFSLEHSACYRRPLDHFIPLEDRYKNCPDDSKPWENNAQV